MKIKTTILKEFDECKVEQAKGIIIILSALTLSFIFIYEIDKNSFNLLPF